MTTKSAKLNTLIAQAQALGLKVEITTDNQYQTLESISVKIRPNFNSRNNLLEAIISDEFISIHALRSTHDGKPRAFLLNITKYSYSTTKIKATQAKHWIDMMAEDLHRYQTKTAA